MLVSESGSGSLSPANGTGQPAEIGTPIALSLLYLYKHKVEKRADRGMPRASHRHAGMLESCRDEEEIMNRRTTIATVGFIVVAMATKRAHAHDRRAFERARVSLVQAVETAERTVGSGARAVEAEFEGRGDRPGRWDVKILTPDRLLEVSVDAEGGQVLRTENERLERFLRRLTHSELEVTPISIGQAVAAAERHIVGARATEAEVRRRDDRTFWEVELLAGERRHKVRVSATDGTIVMARED